MVSLSTNGTLETQRCTLDPIYHVLGVKQKKKKTAAVLRENRECTLTPYLQANTLCNLVSDKTLIYLSTLSPHELISLYEPFKHRIFAMLNLYVGTTRK